MTANQEADRIIVDAGHSAMARYGAGAADRADRLAYQIGVLQGYVRELCHAAHDTREELKKVQQELLWERKNG